MSNVPPLDDEGEPPRRGIGSQAPAAPPPSQVPESGSRDADGRDMASEKQRWKAERKSEKRKRREIEASQATPEDVSTGVKEQLEEDDTERAQRMSKKEKRQKKRRPNGNDADTTEKKHEHDTPSGPLPEPNKKSKKERKKKHS